MNPRFFVISRTSYSDHLLIRVSNTFTVLPPICQLWACPTSNLCKEWIMRNRQKCEAHARSTGHPCQAKALANGRCKNHGGMSTGPRTTEGRKAIGAATAKRMASGQQERAIKGFQAWLNGGGREYLSNLAKQRFKRSQWLKLMMKRWISRHVSCACVLGFIAWYTKWGWIPNKARG